MPERELDERRSQMIQAAMESLREVGYEGTTIRGIARRGGFNSALISYYFGGLHGLLLAALDHSSGIRMERYREAVNGAHGLQQMLEVAKRIYKEDVEGGHITIFTEMVGASLAHPELAPELVSRADPWLRFVEEAFEKALGPQGTAMVPLKETAYSVICFYLGVNLMTHLDQDGSRVESLFDVAERVVPMFEPLLQMLQLGDQQAR